ncbi:hypothetical protein B0H67DRAFT_490822, partial [Lasiosphaeris hirsuta]
ELLCPGYAEISDARTAVGKRVTVIKTLRPGIVLYDNRPGIGVSCHGDASQQCDIRLDVLHIMGTSLISYVVKVLAKGFAKVSYNPSGKVVLVNLTEPAKSWAGMIDYWVEWKCEAWIRDLMDRQPVLCSGSIPSVMMLLTGDGENVKVMTSRRYHSG